MKKYWFRYFYRFLVMTVVVGVGYFMAPGREVASSDLRDALTIACVGMIITLIGMLIEYIAFLLLCANGLSMKKAYLAKYSLGMSINELTNKTERFGEKKVEEEIDVNLEEKKKEMAIKAQAER